MLNSGPSGFHNAPISKVILLVTGGVSILASIMKIKHNLDFPQLSTQTSTNFWRIVTNHVPFTTAGELLFGVILIYSFRMFERRMGTRKFGMFVLISMMIYSLLQLALYVLFKNTTLPSGPYSFIFACLSLYISEVPSTYNFRLCGIPATDKIFTYAVALQLMLANFPASFISGILGIFSASIYRSETLKLDRFKFPASFVLFCTRYILPLIQTNKAGQRNPIAVQMNGSGEGSRRSSRIEQPVQENEEAEWQTLEQPSDQNIAFLMTLGFSQEQATEALRRSQNNLQLATNLLLDGTNAY